MAGDWIPMRTNLATDPAVIQVACSLSITESQVIGMLHRLWVWASEHLADGYARGVTLDWIDRHVGATGFAAALLDAGWLRTRSGGVELPNFDRWNSQNAKNRVLTALRMKKKRDAERDDASVTPSSPEKSRGEKKNNPSSKGSADEPRPSSKSPPEASPPEAEKPKAPRATSEKPHPLAIAEFCQRWAEKYGRKYPFNDAKDGAAVAWMLKQVDGDPAKLSPIFTRYLADDDPFFASANHDLGTLRGKFTRWAVESPRREKQARGTRFPTQDEQNMAHYIGGLSDE